MQALSSWCPGGFTSSELADRMAGCSVSPSSAIAPDKPLTISRNCAENRWYGGADRQDPSLPSHSGLPALRLSPLWWCFARKPSAPVGCCPTNPTFARTAESDGARLPLRNRESRYGGHSPGTRSSCLKIGKNFFGLRPYGPKGLKLEELHARQERNVSGIVPN